MFIARWKPEYIWPDAAMSTCFAWYTGPVMTRRDYLQILGAGAAIAQSAPNAHADETVEADRERRMKWWHEARFGMFIHWGVYSTLGRHEWVMEDEGIPVAEYAAFAKT